MNSIHIEEQDMQKLAERFAQETITDNKQMEELGGKDALKWIMGASRKEVLRALKIWERYDNGESPLDDAILGDYFKRVQVEHDFEDPDPDALTFCLSDDFHHWLIGWTDGIDKTWDEIEKIR